MLIILNTQKTKVLLLIAVTSITGVRRSLASASTLSVRLRPVAAVVAGCRGGAATPAAPPVLALLLLALAAFLPAAPGRILGLVVVAVVVAPEDLLLVPHLPGPLLAAFAAAGARLPPPLAPGFVVLVLLRALLPLFVFPFGFAAGVLCLTAASFLLFIA